jgi:hypothetical protein
MVSLRSCGANDQPTIQLSSAEIPMNSGSSRQVCIEAMYVAG